MTQEQALRGRIAELEAENQRLRAQQGECPFRRMAERLATGAVYVRGESIWFNGEAARLVGYEPEELQTRQAWFAALYQGRLEASIAHYEAHRREPSPGPRRVIMRHKNGEERLVEVYGFTEGDVELWLVRDVSEEGRQARLMEQMSHGAQIGGWELDIQSGKCHCTPVTVGLLGSCPGGFHSAAPESLSPPFTPEAARVLAEALELARDEGEPFDLELPLMRPRPTFVRVIGEVVAAEGVTVTVFGSVQDITARRLAYDALRQSEEQKRRLIASSPDCLLEVDRGGTVLYATARGAELLEVSCPADLVGTRWPGWWPDEARPAAEKALADAAEGRPARFQAYGPTRAGSPRWWDVQVVPLSAPPVRLLVAARDMTPIQLMQREKEQFQHDLLQTQKLESLGVLAGGIAHDFNNLLTGILGAADLIGALGQVGEQTNHYINQIIDSAERAAELCRQMLAYAGKGRFVVGPLNLSALVEDTSRLLRLTVSKRATLTLSLASDVPAVMGDVVQMRQVLMNLVINASEALGEADGVIAVSVREGAPPGGNGDKRHVCLEVVDTGAGMDEATRARIFEPFFTTKFTGRGLGLAAVQGIVRGHGGSLHVDSQPGKGSRFCAYFPATEERPPEGQSSARRQAYTGSGAVLVVDDEEQVRQIASDMLRSLGFEPVLAVDGQDALNKVVPGRFRAVVLDLTMPRLDGAQTLALLRQKDERVPVVLMSGYTEGELNERFVGQGLAAFLQKPFTSEGMARALHKALEG
jgi:PAS domain S-box-containing protein